MKMNFANKNCQCKTHEFLLPYLKLLIRSYLHKNIIFEYVHMYSNNQQKFYGNGNRVHL